MTTPPLGLHPLSLGLGALVGAAILWWWGDSHPTPGSATHAAGATLHGTIVPQPAFGSPALPGLIPQAGLASRDDYEWGYLVGPGDSAGSIAEAIVGDDGRYQELVHANPEIPTRGDPGVYLGDREFNFADGTLKPGVGLLLPVPWSRYIDQTGHARGTTDAWPKDPRVTLGLPAPLALAPATPAPTFTPPPGAAAAPGDAATAGTTPPSRGTPYGRVVAMDEEAA